MLSSPVNFEVTGDLLGKLGAGGSDKLESLDHLVLRGEAFLRNLHEANVDTADEFSDNETVAGYSRVVGVVVVGAVVCGLQVVAAVEELADVSPACSFNDELAAGVVGSVVSSIEDQVVEQEEVSLSFSCDGVKFVLGHGGEWSPEFNILANVVLVAALHNSPDANEENNNAHPEVSWAAAENTVLTLNARCDSVDAEDKDEVAQILNICKG